MRATIIIDPNVRVEGGLTFSGFEDVDVLEALEGGASVRVREPEADLEGDGKVAWLDRERGLVYLQVDWATLRPVESAPSGLLAFAHLGHCVYATRLSAPSALWSEDVRSLDHLVYGSGSVKALLGTATGTATATTTATNA